MSMIQAKAKLIVADMQGLTGVAAASATTPTSIITTIMTLITDVMNSFTACGNTPAQVQARMAKPGVIEKLTLRNQIQHRFPSLIAIRTPLMASCLKISETTTVAEVTQMLAEAKA